ncbi:FUSC family protein [Thiocapsa sp.]|uniref:FUSC family protein n=1 Tax=Thiocapsa sp. TaxID=2024551 RepID=UPI0025F6EE7B|nr:FUSC family protein [Thiocapsa sp.]
MPPIASTWHPAAALNALKTTLGVIVAWGMVLWQQLPDPFLAPVAVLFLQTPYLGASLRKGLMRVLGTLAGALLVLVLLAYLIQDRWALIGALSVVVGVSVYMIRNSRYGYAWFMLAITAAIIAGDASMEPSLAFAKAVSRSTEAVIGILVVLVINGLLWPRTGGAIYDRTYRDALAALAEQMRRLGEAVSAGADGHLPQPPKTLRGAPVQLREILAAAALDSGGFRRLQRTYEAQIDGLAAVLGSLMAFGENLRLAAEGERAFLSAPHRTALGSALRDLAAAVEGIEQDPGAFAGRTPADALTAARKCLGRLSADPGREPAAVAESALLHATVFALKVLITRVDGLADASVALAAGRALPVTALAAEVRQPLGERTARALPNALVAAAGFWLMALLWVELQWPPFGVIGLTMVIVVIGVETLANVPVHRRARRLAIGGVAGALLTAPVYFAVMPQLDGFLALSLVLFIFYYPILYFFHALPPPRNLFFLGAALMAILMVQLEPSQTYSATGYLGLSLSILTGFIVGITLLAIFGGGSPQEHLRRTLKNLLGTLDRALGDLADRNRPDFAGTLVRYEQRLRAELQSLAEIVPMAYAAHTPANDRERIDALLDAVETLLIRLGALQRARARWREECGADRENNCPRTDFGRHWREAFQATLRELLCKLDQPGSRVSLAALDANRDFALSEVARVDALRRGGDPPPGASYILGIAGHYIGVARGLRTFAEALEAIDWAAWRLPRF